MSLDRACKPNGGQCDNCGEQHHDETQAVDTCRETQVPLRRDNKGSNLLKIVSAPVQRHEQKGVSLQIPDLDQPQQCTKSPRPTAAAIDCDGIDDPSIKES